MKIPEMNVKESIIHPATEIIVAASRKSQSSGIKIQGKKAKKMFSSVEKRKNPEKRSALPLRALLMAVLRRTPSTNFRSFSFS
jgi:hypothetical protein